MGIDYTTVTEVPGNRVTREQLERMCHRYCFASRFAEGKDVLEVACGAGLGLGYLARRAKSVVGGDCTQSLIRVARDHYRERLPVLCLDAQRLPFRQESRDVVILYEAIYYLTSPETFFREARRVLRKQGVLLIATVNRDWSEFNPSPFSTSYFSVPELSGLLQKTGFKVEMYGAFSVLAKKPKEKMVASIRKIAIALRLIPKTMKGKEFLKKVFYGRLKPLKEEMEDEGYEYAPPSLLPLDIPNKEYKVIYAVARV